MHLSATAEILFAAVAYAVPTETQVENQVDISLPPG